jgi:hypothetical protein
VFAEDTLNLAVQWCYRIDKTNIRWWKKQKGRLYTAWRMLLCGRTVKKDCHMMTLVTEGLVTDGR